MAEGKHINTLIIGFEGLEDYLPFSEVILEAGAYEFLFSSSEFLWSNTLKEGSEYTRKDVVTGCPELDMMIQKDLRASLIQSGMEIFFNDGFCDDVNVALMMRDDIASGVFAPKSSVDESIYDLDETEAFSEMYAGGALTEWFDWEFGSRMIDMEPEKLMSHIEDRYGIDVPDEVACPDFDYSFIFINTK